MASTLDTTNQDPNDQQNQQNKLQTVSTGAGSSGSAGTSAAPSGGNSTATPGNANTPVSPTSQQLQGSGNFTNIQKYLNANQNAGNQIAGQIGNKVSGDVNNSLNSAQNYNTQLGQAVTSANTTAQQGNAYQQQLDKINSDLAGNTLSAPTTGVNTTIQGVGQNSTTAPGATTTTSSSTPVNPSLFTTQTQVNPTVSAADQQTFQNWMNNTGNTQALTGDLNNFAGGNGQSLDNYQQFLAGTAYNPNQLNNLQHNFLTNAQTASTAAQNDISQLNNGQGQLNFLQNMYGGNASPNYTSGMANLDQAFLGQGNGINNVTSQLSGLNNQAQAQLAQAQQAQGTVNNMNTEQAGITSGLNNSANSNQQNYLNMLSSYANPLNQQNEQSYNNLVGALNSYVPGTQAGQANGPTTGLGGIGNNQQNTSGLNSDQMAQFGITGNEGVYNTLNAAAPGNGNNANALLSNYVTQNTPIGAQDYNRIANNSDVSRYNQILGMLNPNSAAVTNPAITSAQVAAAPQGGYNVVQGANGQSALQNALQSANTNFQNNAQNTNFTSNFEGLNGAATGQQLLNQGAPAVNYTYNNGQVDQNPQSQFTNPVNGSIEQQFQNWIQSQNYAPTIGGGSQVDPYLQQINAMANGSLNGAKGGPAIIGNS